VRTGSGIRCSVSRGPCIRRGSDEHEGSGEVVQCVPGLGELGQQTDRVASAQLTTTVPIGNLEAWKSPWERPLMRYRSVEPMKPPSPIRGRAAWLCLPAHGERQVALPDARVLRPSGTGRAQRARAGRAVDRLRRR